MNQKNHKMKDIKDFNKKTDRELTLSTCFDTIKNITDLSNINIKDMLSFEKNELTAETARQYVDAMEELIDKINNMNTSTSQKEQFRAILVLMLSKMCEADCNSILFSTSAKKNKKYRELLDKMHQEFQQERDEHNELRRKYNEKEKDSKVPMPGISLSLTLKNNIRRLKPLECVELMNELELEEKELEEKFKRISVPDNYKDKVNRAYVKPSSSGNQVFIKEGKKN